MTAHSTMKADHLEFRYVTDNEVASLPIIWDEFKLLRVLGKGAFGIVFLAEHIDSNVDTRQVALKIPYDTSPIYDWVKPDTIPRAFRCQQECIERLTARESQYGPCPYIVKSHPRPFATMTALAFEIAAVSITELQMRSSPERSIDASEFENAMPAEFVQYTAVTMVSALVFMHAAGVMWRDGKQTNVLIMPDFTFKAADIGDDHPDATEQSDRIRLAAMLLNMATGLARNFPFPCLDTFKQTLSTHWFRLESGLQQVLADLIDDTMTLDQILRLPYMQSSGTSLNPDDGKPSIHKRSNYVRSLAALAYKSLPKHTQVWLSEQGVATPCIDESAKTVQDGQRDGNAL